LKGVILSIQNTGIETLGTFKNLFESDGYEIETINVKTDLIPYDSRIYSGVVVLGGYMSVYENLPYLQEEQQLIRNANKHKVPVLGICLGSQLIAQALGGRVYKGKQKEIGWYDVTINDAGRNDIFRGIETKTVKVFQWHGDIFDLPESAILLASSASYPQAFRVRNNIAILFHLEVSFEMVSKWVLEYKSELTKEGIVADDILHNKRFEFEHLANYCKVVYSNFSKLIKFCQT
jgi:GMP synthase-like glutamine amidotransferase